MADPHAQQPSPRSWLPPRSFWIWAVINVVSFVFFYYLVAGYVWSVLGMGQTLTWQARAPLAYALAHPDEYRYHYYLWACIPGVVGSVLLVGVLLWRRRLICGLGAILGLLLGTYSTFLSFVYPPNAAAFHQPDLPLLLVHWAQVLR